MPIMKEKFDEGITISFAKKSDLHGVAALMKKEVSGLRYYNGRAKKEYLGREPRRFEKWLEEDGRCMVVAKHKKDIIGFITGWNDDMDPTIFWQDWVVVDRNFRHLGLVRRMVEYRISADKRIRKIIIDTISTNKEGVSVAKHYGFRQVGYIKNFWFNQDYILWDKDVRDNHGRL